MNRMHETMTRYRNDPYGGHGRLAYNPFAMAKDIIRLEDECARLREALETAQQGTADCR